MNDEKTQTKEVKHVEKGIQTEDDDDKFEDNFEINEKGDENYEKINEDMGCSQCTLHI